MILCDECNEPENAPQHAKRNWVTEGGEGHPFVDPRQPGEEPRCVFPGCDRTRAKHKGAIGHSFTLNAGDTASAKVPPPPKATEKALAKLRDVREKAMNDSTMGGYVVTAVRRRPEKVERVLELADEIRTRREELELLEQELGGLIA